MIYLKKNLGIYKFGDRLFLDVYVPPLFASIVDMHIWLKVWRPRGAGFSRRGCLNQAAPPLSLFSYV